MADINPINPISTHLNPFQKGELKRKKGRYDIGTERIQLSSDPGKVDARLDALESMSEEVRPDMVELGKQLARANDFPSSENLDKLAEALLDPLEDLI